MLKWGFCSSGRADKNKATTWYKEDRQPAEQAG